MSSTPPFEVQIDAHRRELIAHCYRYFGCFGEAEDAVQELRRHGDGDISVVGGIETVRSLFLAGLIDELTLTTHPVIAGRGRRLFEGDVPLARLRLLRSEATPSGNAILTYGPRESS